MKVYTYVIIMATVMLLFTFMGFTTGASTILTTLGLLDNPNNLTNSTFYAEFSAILAAVAVAGIVIGFFTKSDTTDTLVVPFVIFLASFVLDIAGILADIGSTNGSTGWIYMIAAVMIIPFIAGFFISLVELFGLFDLFNIDNSFMCLKIEDASTNSAKYS